jgi:hypothetical protein
MTQRHSGYLVILGEDIREDDAESTILALKMIKGVQSVEPVADNDYCMQLAGSRRDFLWAEKLRDLMGKGPA